MFQVFDPKLIGISIVFDRKSQVLQSLDTSSNRSIPKVVQIMQSGLLFLVGTNQFLFKSDLLFKATSVVDVGRNPLYFGLSLT